MVGVVADCEVWGGCKGDWVWNGRCGGGEVVSTLLFAGVVVGFGGVGEFVCLREGVSAGFRFGNWVAFINCGP